MAGQDLFASGVGLDVTQPVAGTDLFSDPNAPGAFKKGLKTSAKSLKGTAAGALALAGELTGIDSLKQYGLEAAASANEEAAETSMRVEDIEGVGGAVDFAKYGAGYLVPQLATAVAAGLLGRVGGAVAARGISDPAKALLARNSGMTAGLATSSIAQEAGAIYPEAVEAGLPDAAARSVVGGTLAGSLDVLPQLLAAKMLGAFGKRQANPAKGISEILKGGAKGAAGGALVEGATELGQTAIERVAADQSLTDEQAQSDFLNAGVLGALMGGGVGAPVGALRRAGVGAQPPVAAPVVQPPPVVEVPPVVEEAPDTSATPSPFQSFSPEALRLIYTADNLTMAGREDAPVVTPLDQLRTQIEAQRGKIAQLVTEVRGPAQPFRKKQTIAKEIKEAQAELDDMTKREASYKPAPDLPEYQPKGSIVAPVIIGETPAASATPKPIITPQEDEVLRLAEKGAADAAKAGNFKGYVQPQRVEGAGGGQATGTSGGNRLLRQTPGTARSQSSVETQLGLIKRGRGLLLSESEAKAVRDYDKEVPRIEVPVTGGVRSTAKTLTARDRREGFAAAYTKGVETILSGLSQRGGIAPERAKSLSTSLKRAVEAGLAQPDAASAATAFNAAFDKALKGKLPKQDVETFRNELTSYVAANLPKEIAEPSDKALPATVVSTSGAPRQQTLFNKGATKPMVEFTHWGDVPGGSTNPAAMGRGVRGADWPLAKAVGLQYTSAVVKGSDYREPRVQGRQQYEGAIPADKVYIARSDDPLLAQAREEIRTQFGPSEGIAWMRYAQKVRDAGYDAIMYAGGQLRVFTPQSVRPVSTNIFESILPSLSEDVVQTRAKEVFARHSKTGGSSTYIKSGQDAAGTNAYAVSTFKQRELVVPGSLNQATVAAYIRANDDLLASDTYMLGTWYDADTNRSYLDVSQTTPDMRSALNLARENDQFAIFDLRTLTTINLGHPLFDAAQEYNASVGLPPIQELSYIPFDPAAGKQIARAYDQLRDVNPDPAVKAAFDAMALEEEQMFNIASKYIKIESWTKEGQPYKNSAEMRADVFGKNHLWVFAGGDPHPYRNPDQVFRGRAVHDLFAHARTGFEFGPNGELNATRMHAQMYSENALPALIVDNIGQNAWVNFSDANEGLPPAKRAFAAQKVDLLPRALWARLLEEPRQSRAAAVQRMNRTMEDKGERVLSYLESIVGSPKELEVRLVEDLAGGVGAVRISDAKAVIELSMNAKDIMSVAAHEGYHYLELRAFTAPERRIVREAFVNGGPLHSLLMQKARAYDLANGTKLADEINAVPAEARAYGFEFWRRGELEVSGPVQRIFAALRRLLERISNYVTGIGFTSYEDIFLAIEKGDYARRELQGMRSGTLDTSYIESIEPDALPTSEVLHRNKDAASRAKGRPTWIKSPADLAKMRKLLKGLASEGTEAKDWYRRSAQAILAWAGGDKRKAGKLASLVAMYSPRTPVGQDLRHALQHYAQWEAGQPINAGGTRRQAEYGNQILDGKGYRDYLDQYTLPGSPDNAPKITSFFKNLMLTIDPVAYPMESQDATIDMWMSHIFGFGSKDGKLSDANYWWADAEIKRLATEMGIAPDQVQAAVWVSIKARGNMVRSLARKQGIEQGWFTRTLAPANVRDDLMGKGGRPTVYKLKPNREFDYMVNWIRLALTVPFSKANFDDANYSYAEALRDVSDGTLPLNRLDFDFEVQAGLFDDIAFGKVTQGELTFYSRAASLAEVAQRVREGELPRTQLNALWAEAVDHQSTPPGLRESIMGVAGAEAKGALGSVKRLYSEHLSSGLNLARHSAGYKNAFNVMTSYTQRKSRLIADAVERRLSEWTGPAAGTQADKAAASAALLKRTENAWTETSPELLNLRQSLTDKQRSMFDQATRMIAHELDAELKADTATYRALFSDDAQFAQWYTERFQQVERLKNEGYFPERRYGDHVVHAYVTGPDGKKITVYYSQHQREAEARTELTELQALLPDEGLTFEYGYRYQADYDGSISFAQFLDIAQRHGIRLTQSEKERIGKALIAADSTRRNRIFRRKNIAGYSEDGMRVLAEFGVTMANKVAYSELGRAMNDAVNGKEVEVKFTPTGEVEINTYDRNMWELDGEKAGFYRNLVDKTLDFTMSPHQQNPISRGLRMAASAHFLGGSAAAMMVNTTALPMNTVPWLTQHTTYTDAVAKVVGGAKLAVQHLNTIRDLPKLLDLSVPMAGIDEVEGLRNGLQIAAQDGTILDTEIYQIMGLSRGQEYSLSGRVQAAVRTWMLPFRLSEQFNRVSTFIAAYKVAKDKNLTNEQAYKLAQDTVYSTQFRYDEANRPALARSNLGALLFVFKTYPIFATEMMAYLIKTNPRSAAYMLLTYTFMAGLEGLPFAEDIEDLIDVLAQRFFGSPFNTKRALRNVLKTASEAVVGADLSSVMLHGMANELTGLSFASRVGLGNLIPATRLGAADADYKRVLSDVLGPVGSLVTGVAGGVDALSRGRFNEAAKQALPLAAQNLIKGWEQYERGYATDIGGRRLVDVGGMEAFWQSLGFSSSALSKAYATDSIDKQTSAYYSQVKIDLTSDLAKAIRSGDATRVADVVETITEWNRSHPQMPMAVSPASVRRQVQLSSLPLNERTLKLLPKGLRGSSESALGLEQEDGV